MTRFHDTLQYAKDIEKAIYTSELNLAPQLAAGDEEGMLRVPIPK